MPVFAALIPLMEVELEGTKRQYTLKNDEEVSACLKEAAKKVHQSSSFLHASSFIMHG